MRGIEVPRAVLIHWYACGRKRPLSEAVASLYAPPTKSSYPCPFGEHWHVGRKASGPVTFNRPRMRNAAKAWDQIVNGEYAPERHRMHTEETR
jgi:hypothetical protein